MSVNTAASAIDTPIATPPEDAPPCAQPSAPASPPRKLLVIEPTRGWVPLDFRALWEYRELLYFLAWRDVKVRYKQTALGILWALIQPLLAMAIFTVIFGRIAKLPSDGVPYPLFSYAALLAWTYFAGAATAAGNSLVGNSNLITKVYFPRLIVPLAAAMPGLVDFAISFLVLLVLMLAYGVLPTVRILTLPLFLALTVITAAGAGLWIAALTVRFRDVKHVLPFLMQVWLYATPVVYATSMVPERWRWAVGLNPMAGVVEGFRWSLLGGSLGLPGLGVSTTVAALMALTGLYFFRRVERTFADIV